MHSYFANWVFINFIGKNVFNNIDFAHTTDSVVFTSEYR